MRDLRCHALHVPTLMPMVVLWLGCAGSSEPEVAASPQTVPGQRFHELLDIIGILVDLDVVIFLGSARPVVAYISGH